MRTYELTVVVGSDVGEEDLNGVVNTIQGWVEADQGKVTNVDHWGRRRLAYDIREYHEGQYVLLGLELDPQTTSGLERNLMLNDRVLRHLLIRTGE
ncbi:MAG TPA: 30S ribosomal protein S6 [Aggregatilineales bacterium]|nr:30S ribosomal protein S6 [Aggregatilineales bacterium]